MRCTWLHPKPPKSLQSKRRKAKRLRAPPCPMGTQRKLRATLRLPPQRPYPRRSFRKKRVRWKKFLLDKRPL